MALSAPRCTVKQHTRTSTWPLIPTAHKRAVVRSLMCRAETLSSSGVNWTQEEKRVQESLQRNGYPARFVQRHSLLKPSQDEEQTAQASVTIPYIHGLSQSIRRVLTPPGHQRYLPLLPNPEAEATTPKGPPPRVEEKRRGLQHSLQ